MEIHSRVLTLKLWKGVSRSVTPYFRSSLSSTSFSLATSKTLRWNNRPQSLTKNLKPKESDPYRHQDYLHLLAWIHVFRDDTRMLLESSLQPSSNLTVMTLPLPDVITRAFECICVIIVTVHEIEVRGVDRLMTTLPHHKHGRQIILKFFVGFWRLKVTHYSSLKVPTNATAFG